MSKNIPFPPVVGEISARNAAAAYEASRRRRATPAEHVAEGDAAYRLPDGTVRPAYDLYKPEYPERAEPGLSKVRYTPAYSANGYEGYKSHAFDFVPAKEFTRSAPLHDPEAPQDRYANIAVARVTHGDRVALLWAIEDAQLQEWENTIPKGAKFERIRVDRSAMAPGDIPGSAFLIETRASRLVMVAPTDDKLRDRMLKSFPAVMKEGGSFQELGVAMADKYDWVTLAQTGLDLPEPDAPYGKDRIGILNSDFQREIMIPEYGKPTVPFGVMIRPAEQLRFASIRVGDTDPVMVWAYDDAALDRRITNTLLEADGQDRRFGHFDSGAEAVIAQMKDALPDLDIRKGRGGSHMAWGREPAHIAIATEIASGHHFGFASSNEDHLCQIGADLMAPEAETCDIDDLNDLRWKPEVTGRFEILDMRNDELPARKAALRDAVLANRNLAPEFG